MTLSDIGHVNESMIGEWIFQCSLLIVLDCPYYITNAVEMPINDRRVGANLPSQKRHSEFPLVPMMLCKAVQKSAKMQSDNQDNPILFVVQNASDARRFCFSDADATDTKSRAKTLTCVDRVYIRCTYIHEKGDIVTLRCKLQKRLVATIQNIPMGKNAFNFRLFRGWLAIIHTCNFQFRSRSRHFSIMLLQQVLCLWRKSLVFSPKANIAKSQS